MAIRIFQWGTVKSTPNGVSLVFGSGNRFDLTIHGAKSVEGHIRNTSTRLHFSVVGTTGSSLFFRLEWDPCLVTPKSIFKIGRANQNSGHNNGWAAGTTPTLLSFDEAMELAGAIRSVIGLAKTQTAMAAP